MKYKSKQKSGIIKVKVEINEIESKTIEKIN